MVATGSDGRAIFNAAEDLIAPNLAAGRGDKIAYVDDDGSITYAELEQRVRRAQTFFSALGLRREERVLLLMLDRVALPVAFLGAIRAGIVPVLANTLLTAEDYRYLLADSRARVAVVSDALAATLGEAARGLDSGIELVVEGGIDDRFNHGVEAASAAADCAPTCADEACFWLYSSGSTGRPKGTVHAHSSMRATAEHYAGPVLGISEKDIVFSAAKLFFAYGLGNALTFPLSVGATTILMAGRPTPESVFARLAQHDVTIFYGVPTLYAALLAHAPLPSPADLALRRCTSAGEALPADIAHRWTQHFGVPILDGIGSTEMLHIFLSNRPDDVRPGTTGKAVPGYELRLVDDDEQPVAAGELGELQVRGPSAALMYWNQRDKTRHTFAGNWTRTGDKYLRDDDGYYVYGGRSDDMLKVGGIYVSPAEVEGALVAHESVLEAAVVGHADAEGLVKPRAFVVVNAGVSAGAELAAELQNHVKSRLAPYKYPRRVDFVDELPKTATGKIQRFKLRQV